MAGPATGEHRPRRRGARRRLRHRQQELDWRYSSDRRRSLPVRAAARARSCCRRGRSPRGHSAAARTASYTSALLRPPRTARGSRTRRDDLLDVKSRDLPRRAAANPRARVDQARGHDSPVAAHVCQAARDGAGGAAGMAVAQPAAAAATCRRQNHAPSGQGRLWLPSRAGGSCGGYRSDRGRASRHQHWRSACSQRRS